MVTGNFRNQMDDGPKGKLAMVVMLNSGPGIFTPLLPKYGPHQMTFQVLSIR